MFRPSANVWIVPARPSGPKSERIFTVSRGFVPGLRGIGILDRVGHPEPAPIVEGEVERLVDVRLGGDELDLEARRHVQRLLLLGGRPVRERRDVLHRRGFLAASRGREDRQRNDKSGRFGRAEASFA